MSQLCVLQTTFPIGSQAQSIGKILVERGLAACAQVAAPITSVFVWNSQICQEAEVVLTLKTLKTHQSALSQALKDLHPYEVPEILTFEVWKASEDYEKWVNLAVWASLD